MPANPKSLKIFPSKHEQAAIEILTLVLGFQGIQEYLSYFLHQNTTS